MLFCQNTYIYGFKERKVIDWDGFSAIQVFVLILIGLDLFLLKFRNLQSKFSGQ